MKKLAYLMFSIILLLNFSSFSYGETSGIENTSLIIDNQGGAVEIVNIEEAGKIFIPEDIVVDVDNVPIAMGVNSTNIINTDISNIVNSSYIYYYGQGCPHCADLDSYLKKTGGYDKLDLVKKEVWYDKENSVEMMEAVERLGLKADDVGIPFVVVKNGDKENYLIGSSTVIDYLKPYLGDISNSNKKVFVFVILGILAVIIPTALIKISNKN